jgi:hypothetical protein
MKTKGVIAIHIVSAVIGQLVSAINVTEWVRVGILRRTAGYPFGGEGPVPYFYKTAELYSLVNCIFGALFLTLSVVVLWAVIKKQERMGWVGSWSILAALIVMFVNEKIAL